MHAAAERRQSDLSDRSPERGQAKNLRRHSRAAIHLPVELRHEDFREPFPADSIDLSEGGLALRGPFQPEVGDRLLCRFACPPEGHSIEVSGEVVWSEDEGARRGEFGMRFEDLDPDEEKALAELVDLMAYLDEEPEEAAYEEKPAAAEEGAARLHLDGVATPIDAQVLTREGRTLTVEQELPFLRMGMGVTLESALDPARGELHGVQLRVVDGVPRLILEVGLRSDTHDAIEAIDAADATLRGLIEPAGPAPAVVGAKADVSTLDEEEPLGGSANPEAAFAPPPEIHEMDTPVVEVPSVSLSTLPRDDFAHQELAYEGAYEEELEEEDEGPALLLRSNSEEEGSEDQGRESSDLHELDEPLEDEEEHREHPELDEEEPALEDEDEDEDDRSEEGEQGESEDAEGTAPTPLAARAQGAKEAFQLGWGRVVVFFGAVWGWLRENAKPGLLKAWGATRSGAAAALAWLRARTPEGLGAKLGGLAGKLRGGLGKKKRRTTALPPRDRETRGSKKRVVRRRQKGEAATTPKKRLGRRVALLAVIAFLGLGLTVYALAGGSEEEVRGGIRSHRPISAETATPAQPRSETAREATPEPQPAREAAARAAAPRAAAVGPVQARDPRALPEARSEAGRMPPPTYPSLRDAQNAPAAGGAAEAAEGEAAAPAPAAAVRNGRSFGAAEVANGRAFTINMSRPITSIEGQATEGGFTVTVHGALALAGARSIAARHPGVERATILNRGDHAVLDIAFVSGQSPAYQVRARGRALEVTLGM